MNKWSAHMLTGIEKMTRMMRAVGTSRTDECGPACWRGEARGVWRVARVAVVAVMAMVFGVAGFVGSAEAVTYYMDSSNGNAIATGITTNSNCADRTSLAIVEHDTATAGCASMRVEFGGNGTMVESYFDTAYGGAMDVTGGTWYGRLRDNAFGGWQVGFRLFYVTADGTQTNFSGAEATFNVPSGNSADRTIDLSAQTATVPAGAKLGLRIRGISGSSSSRRIYWGNDGADGGGNGGILIVTEVPACTPDAAPSISGTVNGDPIDICSVVTDGTNTTTNYKVTGGGGSADIDPNGTYIEAENYNQLVAIGAPNTGVVADGAANGGFAMETTNGGTSNTADGDRLEFDVNFPTGGTYYFWLRMLNSGAGDSGFFGIDGTMVGAVTQTSDGAYYWTNSLQTGALSTTVTAGTHTINIWGRENVFIDGIYITTDNGTPPGLGGGLGANTGTIPTGATVIDPTNTSTVLYDGAGCSVATGTWTDGSQDLEVTYTDSCGTTGQTTTGTFTFTSCTETKTLTLDTISDPITGTTTIQVTAGSDAASILVGDTDPPTQSSGWSYNPPASAEGSVTFYAQGTGDCGTMTDSVTVNYDTKAPTVSSSVPADTDTGVVKDSSVTINFSEAINCTTVDNSSVTISPATTTWVRTSCSGSTAVFAPTGQTNSTAYTVTVDASIADLAGNNMVSNAQFSYTTDCDDLIASSIAFNGVTTAAGDFAGLSMVTPTDLTSLEYRVTGDSTGAPTTDNITASGTWTAPAGVTSITVACWGGGGGGGGAQTGWNDGEGAGGGAGGAYASSVLAVSPLTGYTVTIGASGASGTNGGNGGTGGNSWFDTNTTLFAEGGVGGEGCFEANCSGVGGTGSAASSIGDTTVTGVSGADGVGNNAAGGDGGAGGFSGGAGGAGGTNAAGSPGTVPGGGGGGAGEDTNFTNRAGGAGAAGRCDITYSPLVTSEYIPWNADPQEANGVLTDSNTYTLYARGYDAECGVNIYYVGGGAEPGTGQDFVWSSCTETRNLTLSAIADPITGDVTVTATGSALNIQVGTTPAPTNASGWTYSPAQDDNTTTVSFYATGDGVCGQLADSQLNVSTDTMAAPVVTAFVIPATVVDTSAPLEVPITTFTATDNVAVTGYMITESVTAPGAGDGGWLGSAPATYTVAAYGSYTLYAWAKDAAGNVSTSLSAPVTVSNCSPTLTALTISAAPNPISGPTPGTSTITLTPTGDTVTSPQWSDDGGSNWYASGTTYTAPTQTNSSVNITGRATEDTCSTVVSATNEPYALNFDTRTNYIEPGTATRAQSGVDKVKVTMPYLGINDNSSASVSVAYDLNGSAQTPVTTDPITGAGPAIINLGAFSDGDAITSIVVTYADTRWGAAPGNAVQALADITIVAWFDDQMLHNSLRFACSVLDATGKTIANSTDCTTAGGTWNEDRRYTGGWGTSGADDQYSAILCATCHEKASGNIKRVTTTIGLAGVPGAAETISYTTAVDGTSDLTEAAGDHGSSNKVCEACHTYSATDPSVSTPTSGVRFHGYDMSGASAANQNHYLGADCIKCHEHKMGFRASCNACHGNPPTTVAELTATMYPSASTGSGTPGEHLVHAEKVANGGTLEYDCNYCHTGWEASGQMPNGGAVNVGFAPFGTDDAGAVYTGRNAALYNAGALTTVDNTDGTSPMTCAIYCHGDSLGGTPVGDWDDGTGGACGDCHAVTDAAISGLPSGTAHNVHVIGQGLDCSSCHGTGYSNAVPGSETAPFGHVNGTVNYNVATLPSSTTATYNGATSGTINNWAPSVTYGSCANVTCHGSGTPQWGNTLACDSCHGYPPTSGNHVGGTIRDFDHTTLATAHAQSGKTEGCIYCHGYEDDGASAKEFANQTAMNGGVDMSAGSDHADGKTTMNGDLGGDVASTRDDANYAVVSGSVYGCSTAACHSDDINHQITVTGTANLQLREIGPGACSMCHNTVSPLVAGTPQIATGANNHVELTPGATYGDCTNCHVGHTTHSTSGGLGGYVIANNGTLGIDYDNTVQNGHAGIMLGGRWTDSSISGVTSSEAEICWGCHEVPATDISEWGLNTDTNGTENDYNFGTVTNNDLNWTTTTWSSATYSYKNGPLYTRPISGNAQNTGDLQTRGDASIHASAGTPGTQSNALADVSCTYCHDVHDTFAGSPTGKPYLRGSWMGNPYLEDGAPRSGDSWTGTGRFGDVPRGETAHVGSGYQIDQNNGNPTSTWNADGSSGLCAICHGSGGDDSWSVGTTDGNGDNEIDRIGSGAGWVGTNGHSNAVLGGTGNREENIFSMADRNSTVPSQGTGDGYLAGNPAMAYSHQTNSSAEQYGFRPGIGDDDEGWIYSPMPPRTISRRAFPAASGAYDWGASIYPDTSIDTQYHQFSCSKCHNPHASRLPRLMISNCLDTKVNDWDDDFGTPSGTSQSGDGINSTNSGVTVSQFTSAQNCHRVKDPAFSQSRGAGWNTVTPW